MANRIVRLVVGLLITTAVSIGMFTAEAELNHFKYDNYSETFVGVISSASYETKEATVEGFVANELYGASAQPIYRGYDKISDLTQKEINELAIDEQTRSEIVSAEKVSVKYVSDSKEKQVNTCVLEMDGCYRYYVSLSLDGEALTNSYFDSVLDGAKYLNCTSNTVVNMRVNNRQTTSDVSYRQVIKFDDDIAYFDQAFPGMDYEMYFTEEEGSIDIYMEHPDKKDGKLYSLARINRDLRKQNLEYRVYLTNGNEQVWLDTLSTMQDITDFMFMMELDASYFVKTPYGFSMPEEKYKEVCCLMLGEYEYQEMIVAWEKHFFNFSADYYVTEGRLSASKITLSMSDGNDVFALTVTVNYTDFGTTEVYLPYSVEN